MRCLIVDDSAGFLEAACKMLECEGITVVGTACTTAEGLRLVERLQPDVTLIDIDLGGESGFDFAEQLHRTGSSTRSILISTHAEEDMTEMIAASPVDGFLPKLELSLRAITEILREK